jgi:DNA-binding PadR family transcriptional regulator
VGQVHDLPTSNRESETRYTVTMRYDATRHKELSEQVLLILLSLAEEPRHGYAILKDVEELSTGRIKLSTGTLYGALRRLLEERWIEYFREKDAPRERQAYRLTSIGRQALDTEVSRMKLLTKVASLRLAKEGA